MKIKNILIIAFLFFLLAEIQINAQEPQEAKLTKKELRAKRKKAREIQRMNEIYQIHKDARELLTAKDFVLKSDGRSGRTTTNFFRINGDTVTVQFWSNATGGPRNATGRPMRVEGIITNFHFMDGGDDGPIQAEIDFVERFTYRQRRAFVYIIGKRAEAGFIHDTNINAGFGAYIRGTFSSVEDSNVLETKLLSTSVRPASAPSTWQLGGF